VYVNYFCRKLYDNFGLIIKCSENMATEAIENWPLSTTPLSIIDTFSCENPCSRSHISPIVASESITFQFMQLSDH